MGEIWFQSGGPLLADSPVYVVREADAKAATCLQQMEYITLFEPREHGKTSLINRLVGRFSSRNYCFAVRDLMAARSSAHSATDWYSSLGEWLLRQLSFVPERRRLQLPIDCASWERFLANIAESAETLNRNVVIVLDEAGAIPSDWSTDFFSLIRSVYTSRQNLSFWQHLTFIIAGAVNPRELIRDSIVSNFNVAQSIALPDFDLPQVVTLTSHLSSDRDVSQAIAERIYYWTDGQPYLCQRLCVYLTDSHLAPTSSDIERTVDNAVKHLFQDDTHHLARISKLRARPESLTHVRRIAQSPDIFFSAALNDTHFELAHVSGVVKPTADGMCKIRNRIYERALSILDESSAPWISPQMGNRPAKSPVPPSADTELTHKPPPLASSTAESPALRALKHKTLEKHLADLSTEYEAANSQISYALTAVDRLRIQRQIEALEAEIGRVDAELKALG